MSRPRKGHARQRKPRIAVKHMDRKSFYGMMDSMTVDELRRPNLVATNPGRARRIARGAGIPIGDVKRLARVMAKDSMHNPVALAVDAQIAAAQRAAGPDAKLRPRYHKEPSTPVTREEVENPDSPNTSTHAEIEIKRITVEKELRSSADIAAESERLAEQFPDAAVTIDRVDGIPYGDALLKARFRELLVREVEGWGGTEYSPLEWTLEAMPGLDAQALARLFLGMEKLAETEEIDASDAAKHGLSMGIRIGMAVAPLFAEPAARRKAAPGADAGAPESGTPE